MRASSIPVRWKASIAVITLIVCSAFASSDASAQFIADGADEVVTSVSDILLKPVKDQPVVLRGRIVGEFGDDKFTFTDESAEIRVIIPAALLQGKKIEDTSLLEIRGKVGEDFESTPEIWASSVTVVSE